MLVSGVFNYAAEEMKLNEIAFKHKTSSFKEKEHRLVNWREEGQSSISSVFFFLIEIQSAKKYKQQQNSSNTCKMKECDDDRYCSLVHFQMILGCFLMSASSSLS